MEVNNDAPMPPTPAGKPTALHSELYGLFNSKSAHNKIDIGAKFTNCFFFTSNLDKQKKKVVC